MNWRTTPISLCWSNDLQLEIQKRCSYLKNVALLWILGYSRNKSKEGGWRTHLFWERSLEFLDLSLYSWKFQTKRSFITGNFTKLCYTHWNYQTQKPSPMEITHDFFLINPGNSTSSFIDPWNFHSQFFNTPGNSMSSTLPPPVWIFSGIALFAFGFEAIPHPSCYLTSIVNKTHHGTVIAPFSVQLLQLP